MKSLLLNHPGEFKVVEKDYPHQPGLNEVLLKTRCLGICGTDLHAFHGAQPFFTYPRILGHEIAAQVVSVGENVTHLKKGDLCTVLPYRNAFIDQAVKRGKPNCGTGLSYFGVHEDGAMQEYFIYDARNVFPANALTQEQVAMIEPLSIGSHAVERAEIKPDDIVLIVGAGPIGITTLIMGRLKAARFLVLDTNEQRLDFVRQRYAGVDTLKADDYTVENLKKLLNGDLPTIVMDATGNRESMLKCFDYVAAGGTIIYVGIFVGSVEFFDPLLHAKEITLKASRNSLPIDFKKIIRLMESGIINIDGLITHRLQFSTLENSFTSLYNPEEHVIKAIVEFN
ncbi:MAG: zinc-binding alcohol dehydrogenase family protein [Ginsengibacter sp.]